METTRVSKSAAIKKHRARAPPPTPPPRRRASRSRASSGTSRRARARSDHLGERAERLEADLRVASDAKSALLEERALRISETEAKRVEMEQTAEAWKREAFDKRIQTFEADLERARFERDRAEDARAELAERLAQSESRNERAFDASPPKTTPGGVVSDSVVSDAVVSDSVSFVPNTPGSDLDASPTPRKERKSTSETEGTASANAAEPPPTRELTRKLEEGGRGGGPRGVASGSRRGGAGELRRESRG